MPTINSLCLNKYCKKEWNNFACYLLFFIFAKDSVGPKGLVGNILDSMIAVFKRPVTLNNCCSLRKGRLRTLSSTYKSRKFEPFKKIRQRNVCVGCIISARHRTKWRSFAYNMSRRGLAALHILEWGQCESLYVGWARSRNSHVFFISILEFAIYLLTPKLGSS